MFLATWLTLLFCDHLPITLTVVGGIVLIVILQLVRGKQAWTQLAYDVFGVGALALAVATSLHVFQDPFAG